METTLEWHQVAPNISTTPNCTANITAYEEPAIMQQNVVATVVLSSLSLLCSVFFIIHSTIQKTHNQWPHSQIIWLTVSILAFNVAVLLGGFWGYQSSRMPADFCLVQGVVVQFTGLTITGWFLIITVTMRQMINEHHTVHQLGGKSRAFSFAGVFVFAGLFTLVPLIFHLSGWMVVFGPGIYNTWCWITICDWDMVQLVFFEGSMLLIVVVGSIIALVAMAKLWQIRKYSSQSFQPRIRIYMYRRLAFISIYGLEIFLLVVVWILTRIDETGFTNPTFVINKAVLSSAGVLLFLCFGVPDSWCMCRRHTSMWMNSAKTNAEVKRQAELEATERHTPLLEDNVQQQP